MGADTSIYSDVLKEDYQPDIAEQINNDVTLLHFIENDADATIVGGQYAVESLHIKRNPGIGSRAEGGVLPVAGNQGFDRALFYVKQSYGRMQLSGKVMAVSQGDDKSFISALDAESKGLARDLTTDANRMMFGDGSGILAQPTSDGIQGSATASEATVNLDSIKHVEIGSRVDLVTASNGNAVSGGQSMVVKSVDRTNNRVTFTTQSTLASAATTAGIYRVDSRNQEIFGLDAITDDANSTVGVDNFGSIDRSDDANDFWRGNQFDKTGENFDTEWIKEAYDEIELRGGGRVDYAISDFSTWRKIAEISKPDIRYPASSGYQEKIDRGLDIVEFDGVGIARDRQCPTATLYLFDSMAIRLYNVTDWQFMDFDGEVLNRVNDKDAYEATMFRYWQLGSNMPNATGKVFGYNTTTTLSE